MGIGFTARGMSGYSECGRLCFSKARSRSFCIRSWNVSDAQSFGLALTTWLTGALVSRRRLARIALDFVSQFDKWWCCGDDGEVEVEVEVRKSRLQSRRQLIRNGLERAHHDGRVGQVMEYDTFGV